MDDHDVDDNDNDDILMMMMMMIYIDQVGHEIKAADRRGVS